MNSFAASFEKERLAFNSWDPDHSVSLLSPYCALLCSPILEMSQHNRQKKTVCVLILAMKSP